MKLSEKSKYLLVDLKAASKWQSSSSITYIFIMLIELDMQVIISLDEQNK